MCSLTLVRTLMKPQWEHVDLWLEKAGVGFVAPQSGIVRAANVGQG